MQKRIGSQTIQLGAPVGIISTASIAGPKEGEGLLSAYFDQVLEDELYGETSWEKAESRMVKEAIALAIRKAKLRAEDIDFVLAGDLLNQNTATTFGVREIGRPFLGLYSACSTMGESLCVGAMLIDGGFAGHVVCSASSHFCAAEKQFRFPLELGTQRPLTSTWTVTGDGAAVLSADVHTGVCVTDMTIGKIVDMGITDANNMGAAMAPAAADTILAHFRDTGRAPSYYDEIVTGDLGYIGRDLVLQILANEGLALSNYNDCGIRIFDRDAQDTHAGGSGCACAALTFAGYYYKEMQKGTYRRILLVPTGALLSPSSMQQGESIPGIAHAVVLEMVD